MGIASGIVASGGTTTTDATAEQWHIKSGKTAYIASGKVTGNAYTPAMMDFDGSTGYYASAYTSAGNKVTGVVRFKCSSFSGGGTRVIARSSRGAGNERMNILAIANDFSTSDYQDKVYIDVENSGGTKICRLISPSGYFDDAPHTLFFAFDGDNGTAIFYIDGSDADDTGNASRIAPTTGTLDAGATSFFEVGGSSGTKFDGDVGFVGHAEAYLTNWSDFMRPDGSPIFQDSSSWAGTGFGAQPKFWNPHGDMVNNLGSAGAMTKNGTINVGNGGT